MICKVFSFLGGEDRSNEKQVFRAQFVTCFRVLKIRSRFSRIALFCIEQRIEIHGNIQRFQPLNPLAIARQRVVYLTLQGGAFGAVCRYRFSLFVPIMRLYRNAERNGFVGALMRKADCQRGLAVFVDDFVSADCFDFHLFAR